MELRSRKVQGKSDLEISDGVLSFRSKKKLSYPDPGMASSCEKTQPSDPTFSLQTPQKPAEILANRRYLRSVDEVKRVAKEMICGRKEVAEPKCETPVKIPKKKPKAELPRKYESLCEQFDSMVSSTRLLKLKGYSPTFVKIAPSVQGLTNRGFSHGHLAQLKYLMPEVIDIKTVVSRDERTSCMKPDLLITLKVNGGGFSDLSKLFRSQLSGFIESNPEIDEVPEATLPQPFNQRIHPQLSTNELMSGRKRNRPFDNESNVPLARESDDTLATPLGCFSTRLRKHFSQKLPLLTSEKTQLLPLTTPQKSTVDDISSPVTSVPHVTSTISGSPTKRTKASPLRFTNSQRLSMFSTSMHATPSKPPVFCHHLETTPMAKALVDPTLAWSKNTVSETESDPEGLLSSTPNLSTPKRARMTPKNDLTPNENAPKMKPKALNFLSPLSSKEKQGGARKLSVDEEIIQSLPSALLQSVKEKEMKMMEENETGFAEKKLRQKMMVSLPKMFDMTYLIFQSANSSVITKQELLYKIATQHLDIIDRSEIEEQLKLLQELIPDWISERMASSGDFIFRINKIVDPDALRARLVDAGRTDT